MTVQLGDFFEYQGRECYLMGYTGGILPLADAYGLEFFPGSTADGRGHCMWYGIGQDQLVVKRIEIRGAEKGPITHSYTLVHTERGAFYDIGTPLIPFTGYLLFSDFWTVDVLHDLPDLPKESQTNFHEVQVNKGHVVGVNEISEAIRERVAKSPRKRLSNLWEGRTPAEQLAHLQVVWDEITELLPRRYDAVYKEIWYIHFPQTIAELEARLKD
jgi:hypothetical protein